MSKIRRSSVWNVFTETHKTDFIATCNICSQEFSYRSTTTNLMKHLQRKHPGINVNSNDYATDKKKEVEIVIQRQVEDNFEVETFKVEVQPAHEETEEFIIISDASSEKKVSPIWEFFTKRPNSDYMALCKICNKELSYKTTTGNLKKHLLRKHPNLLTESQTELEPDELETVDDQPPSPESEKDTKFIENDSKPVLDDPDELDDDDFWNLQDNSDDDPEFRPSPRTIDNSELESKAPSGKKRSRIWNVFTEKPNSDSIALCNVCNQEFCYRSTTNNLKKHFQRKHPKLSMEDKIDSVKSETDPAEDKNTNVNNYSSDEEKDDEEFQDKSSSKRKPSQIWNYFTKKKPGEYVASCNICKKELGYRSTTSNLKKHLGRKHPHVELIKTEVEEKVTTPEVPVKTCLICLQNDTNETKDFVQINSCGTEEKSYMNKIQEVMNQPVVIDESHVLCQSCIGDLEKVLEFKDKIIKAFDFWNKLEPDPEPESEPFEEVTADDINHSDYSDLDDGESLAKFTCSTCRKVFPSPSVMLKHNCMQIRRDKMLQKKDKTNDKYYCEHCGRSFNIKWKLTKHLRKCQNNASRQFVCNMCDRVFKKAYHLREHMASHTGERNYCCNICGKTFQRSSSRHKHMRSHSAKPGEKSKKTPFLCTICGKSFPYSNGASRHMRVHLGERRHQCHICLKKFSQTTHLKVHLRTHSGERPYSCLICGRTFSLNASLRKHMRLHVGSGEFVKLVKNLETNLDTNMEENLGNNLSTTLATSLGVMDADIPEGMEEEVHMQDDDMEPELETNIVHAEVVTEDGIRVLAHHEINMEGS